MKRLSHEDQESWHRVWRRKGKEAAGRSGYASADLFAADGFDGVMAKLNGAALAHIRELLSGNLGIEAGMKILESGCGAGAVLSLLHDSGALLTGVDYSEPHIEIARQAMPEATFCIGEAAALPLPDATFDAAFSYGVFLYFPDLEYASRAVSELLRVAKPGAAVLILDIPDARLRAECEAARRAAGAALKPEHCYYPRAFFESHGFRTFSQCVPGYDNSRYRFNALFGGYGG